jgi:hypothetical protein
MTNFNLKNWRFAAISGLFVAFVSQSAVAQSDTVEVTATLRQAVTVTTQTDVSFGDVDVNLSGTGTLELRPDGTFAASGTDITSAGSGTVSAGVVNISGSNGVNIDVSCTSATVANSAGQTIAVPTSIAEGASATGTTCGGLGSTAITVSLTTGATAINMGATLNIANMSGVTSTGAFSTTNSGGSASTLQAVYQ